MNEAEKIILNLALQIADLRGSLDSALGENRVLKAMVAEIAEYEHTHEEDQEAH